MIARSSFFSRAAVVAALLAGGGVSVAACASNDETRPSFEELPPTDPGLVDTDGGITPVDADRICDTQQVAAELAPIAMIVLIDRSGSMLGEKWTAATQAIRAFADRSEVVGMKMGIQFFPPLAAGDQCNASNYKALAVPIGPLPDNVIPIQQRLLGSDANGGATPMRSGLEGSIGALRDFLAENPQHTGVVILVTDGDPTSCGNVSAVAGTASSGANPPKGTPAIRTFAVGMAGATFGNLDQIAVAGGGYPTAFNVGSGPTAQSALVEALEKVRTQALGCEYVLPLPPPSYGELDLDSVVFEFTPGKNDPKVSVRRVTNEDACGATSGGYYYDDPNDPKHIVLCPASCDIVQGATAEATVELSFGCIARTR